MEPPASATAAHRAPTALLTSLAHFASPIVATCSPAAAGWPGRGVATIQGPGRCGRMRGVAGVAVRSGALAQGNGGLGGGGLGAGLGERASPPGVAGRRARWRLINRETRRREGHRPGLGWF